MIWLYRAPYSTNVDRVALALAKGLAGQVESIVISYDDRSEVEQVSSRGLVPVIDDEGTVVYDSARIIRYLDQRYPDSPLFPADPARRTEMDIFIDWFNEIWKGSPNAIELELESDEPDQEVVRTEERGCRRCWGSSSACCRARSPDDRRSPRRTSSRSRS